MPQITGPFGNKPVTNPLVTLKVKGPSDAVHFEYQITDTPDQSTFGSVVDSGTGATSSYQTTLPDFGTYLFRVLSIDAAGNQSALNQTGVIVYSTMKTPKNNSVVAKPAVTFTWSKPTTLTVTNWTLEVDTDPGFGAPINGGFVTAGSVTKQLVNLPAAGFGQYYWHVKANGGNWMPTQTFFYTLSKTPKVAGFTTDSTPSFTWNGSTGETGWQVHISSGATCGSSPFDNTTFLAGKHTYTPLSPFGAFGDFSWTLDLTGATSGTMPCQAFQYTLMKKPVNGTESTVTQPSFGWGSKTGAVWELQVNDQSDFLGTMVVDTTNTLLPTAISFKPAAPLAPGKYTWRLSADGGTSWMPGWTFIVH